MAASLNAADAAPLQVVDRQAQQFGEKQQGFRPSKNVRVGNTSRAPDASRIPMGLRCALHGLCPSTMTHPKPKPQVFLSRALYYAVDERFPNPLCRPVFAGWSGDLS